METSTKLVTTTIITIFLVSIIVSIIGWNVRVYDSQFSNQTCSREGKYCVYEDIPTGMAYTNPKQSLADIQQFNGNLSDFITSIYYPQVEIPPQPIVGRDGKTLVTKTVPSGVYFYRLSTSDNVQTRKMIMMK